MADAVDICAPEDVLSFWFGELQPQDWFKPHPALDSQCEQRFRLTHRELARGVPPVWRATPMARLATIVLFDQMPRNMYRGTPLAFATDGLALREASLALEAGADRGLSVDQCVFLYLPFEHSENLVDQMDFNQRHCCSPLVLAEARKPAICKPPPTKAFGKP